MRSPEKERLEAKLKLWETPGFSQFLSELEDLIFADDKRGYDVEEGAMKLRRTYINRIREIDEEKEDKFKQGKLDLK